MGKQKVAKQKKKVYNMLDFVLLGILLSLIIVVIGLGIFAVVKHKQQSNKAKVDMSIPVIEETTNTLFLDLGKGKKGDNKEYLFKIKNYYKDKVNTEEYVYKISFTSDPDIGLSLYEDGENKNLLDPKSISTKEFSLKKDIIDEKIFKAKIELKEDTDVDSIVYLKIEGKKKNGNN